MMMVCRNCGKTTCYCLDKSRSAHYAPASDLSATTQAVKDGKLFSVIPTAIGATSVIRVNPTKDSTYDIPADDKERLLILKKLENDVKQMSKPKKTVGSADKHAELVKGLLK